MGLLTVVQTWNIAKLECKCVSRDAAINDVMQCSFILIIKRWQMQWLRERDKNREGEKKERER